MLKAVKWLTATLGGIAIVYYAVSTQYMKSRIIRQKDMIAYLNEKNIVMRERLDRVEPTKSYDESF